jgi:hypothetical protein
VAALAVSRVEERARYDVICAWCQVDGVRNLVRQGENREQPRDLR